MNNAAHLQRLLPQLIPIAALLLATGCGQNGAMPIAPQASTVAALLARSTTEASQDTMVDAYVYFPVGPDIAVRTQSVDLDGCVGSTMMTPLLIDAPFEHTIVGIGATRTYRYPTEAAWLIPMIAPNTVLPYHARYKGHLNDPAYAHCPFPERIFVVDQVVSVFEKEVPTPEPGSSRVQWPADFETWGTMKPQSGGYSFLYPINWRLRIEQTPDTLETITLESPTDSSQQIVIRTYVGESYYDQFALYENQPIIFRNHTMGVIEPAIWVDFYQLSRHAVLERLPKQKLVGYQLDNGQEPNIVSQLVFNGSGNTHSFELHATHPTEAQAAMNIFMALILTLRFEHPMSEYPTSVINTAIGNGPFIGDSDIQAALLARTNEIGQYHQQTTFTYTGKTLISEAEARASNPGCHQFQGHSAGVWRLEGMITDSTVGDGPGVMLIDATTAEIYCAWYTGAVIAPKPTPVPTSLPQSIGGPGSAYPNPPLPNPYPEPTK